MTTKPQPEGWPLIPSPTPNMPVISLHQPWATWIALGLKRVETRTHCRFRCLVGGRIGIHAAQAWDADALRAAAPYLGARQGSLEPLGAPAGAIICTAYVADARWLTPADAPEALIECGATPRRFGLILTDIQPITPIAARGHWGIWYREVIVTA